MIFFVTSTNSEGEFCGFIIKSIIHIKDICYRYKKNHIQFKIKSEYKTDMTRGKCSKEGKSFCSCKTRANYVYQNCENKGLKKRMKFRAVRIESTQVSGEHEVQLRNAGNNDSRNERTRVSRFPDHLPQDNSPHRQLAPSKLAPRHLAPWTTRPRDNSPQGQLAPGTTRPMDNLPHGQLTPWTTRPMDNSPHDISPHGQLAPRTTRPMTTRPSTYDKKLKV